MDTGSDNERRLRGTQANAGQNDVPQDDERGDLDFGSFVSRSVRSTSDRFRGGDGETGTSYTIRSRGGSSADAGDSSDLPTRPSRKWRDSIDPDAGPSVTDTENYSPRSRRFIEDAEPVEEYDDEVVEHDGGRVPPAWWSTVTRNEDGEQDRNRLILLALALLLIIGLIVFALTRFLGGDDKPAGGDDPTATPTAEDSDLRLPVRTQTPESDQPTEPATSDEPTETPRVRDGGDNTLPGGFHAEPLAELTLDGVTYVLAA